jgi:uncharacterized protein YfaS (alpha-2-macroglobulin family)
MQNMQIKTLVLASAAILIGWMSSCQMFNRNKTNTMASNFDYRAAWATVDSLDQRGLPKSALEAVLKIEAAANTDGQVGQQVRCLIHRGKFLTLVEEDGFVKSIELFEGAQKDANQPKKAIVQSYLAQMYTTYLDQNGWNLSQRTPLAEGQTGDISTWSAEQVQLRAHELYLASIEPAGVLQNIKNEGLPEVILSGNNDKISGQTIRPTLYDVLVFRWLDYCVSGQSYLTEPVYAFEMNDPVLFGDDDAFVKANFVTRDSTSNKWLAIQAMQTYTKYLMGLKQPAGQDAALAQLGLYRLKFAVQQGGFTDASSRYMTALKGLAGKYAAHEVSTEVWAELAMHLRNNSENDPKNTTKNHLREAISICESAIKAFPDSRGAKSCQVIIKQIKTPQLSFTVEEVVLPNEPSLVHVAVANTTTLHARVVAVPHEYNDNLYGSDRDAMLDRLRALPTLQRHTWQIPLPSDYRGHNTELMLDALPVGRYAVLVSNMPDFDQMAGKVALAMMVVSNLAPVSTQASSNNRDLLYVVNRKTGAPLAGVRGDFYRNYWNSESQQMAQEFVGTSTTDSDGLLSKTGINLPVYEQYTIKYSLKNDTIWDRDHYASRETTPEEFYNVRFFTDRRIYRPGQTVYFKAVALKYSPQRKPSILPNTSVVVRLRDVNGQDKGDLTLRTNEYGTIQGTFILPNSGLTGTYSLMALGGPGNNYIGNVAVDVEEYKRPRFEVAFEPLEGSYRLRDQVKAVGKATNYAGNPVDGAQVKWSVMRVVRLPYWGDFYRKIDPGYYGIGEQRQIAHGVATTDASGKFTVEFEAAPSDRPDAPEGLIMDYSIDAEVTDVSGETRSANTLVSVSNVATQVVIDVNSRIALDSMRHLSVEFNNLAGQPVAAKGTITITPLKSPNREYIDRKWEKPDVWTLSEATYKQVFPLFAYSDDDDKNTWPASGTPITHNFDHSGAKKLDLSRGLQPGWYELVLVTQDAYGKKIEVKERVEIWDSASQIVGIQALVDRKPVTVGQQVAFRFGARSGLANIWSAWNTDFKPQWQTVRGIQTFQRTLTEQDRGNTRLVWFSVRDNRLYTTNELLIVPYDNKELKITFESFRDKLQPGAQEEWRLRITGPAKDRVAAEVVASMYDASLDQFQPFNWVTDIYGSNDDYMNVIGGSMGVRGGYSNDFPDTYDNDFRRYPQLRWFNFPFFEEGWMYGYEGDASMIDTVVTFDPETYEEKVQIIRRDAPSGRSKMTAMPQVEATQAAAPMDQGGNLAFTPPVLVSAPNSPGVSAPSKPASIRTNLSETVFFYPTLMTDANGDVLIKFKMNEALTRWKFQAFAHTKALEYGLVTKEVVTQKELMITANPPRFLRAGDEIEFSAKVSNLAQNTQKGTATLTLTDATTLKVIEKDFGLQAQVQNIEVAPGQSQAVLWKIKIPADYTGAVTWQVWAESQENRDGESNTVPVVTNRTLVTETLPINLRSGQTRQLDLATIMPSSTTATPHRFTVEFTSNPVWYSVQSLPYLMEYPYECSEQVFSRYYANVLAGHITQKMPSIRRVFDTWKQQGTLVSPLAKNQELKSALLEETPWVLDAQSETQQQANIALLFDLNRMSDEQDRALQTLANRQTAAGGWPWFDGGREHWYITQHIACGIAHLEHLGALPQDQKPAIDQMQARALQYCTREMERQYNELQQAIQNKRPTLPSEAEQLNSMVIQYMYLMSFYPEAPRGKAYEEYKKLIGKHWNSKNLQEQAMLALATHRTGPTDVSKSIVQSLRERATQKDELGMYWPNNTGGMYWYQLPIETQALMIEVFDEVAKDPAAVDELRIWLLKNKQTNRWESTKATSEAIYALLLHSDNWLDQQQTVAVQFNNKAVELGSGEAGTLYAKRVWAGQDIPQNRTQLSATNPNKSIAWGAAYYQYFEDLDKVQKQAPATGISVVKQVFVNEQTDKGKVLRALTNGNTVKVGDQLKVRIEIRCDRPMEFVHLKDMRAAGTEPVNVLSGYRWKDGLGYYESTRDLATNFFIDYLPRGTYVLEYPLYVVHRGQQSVGVATLQCMYAPEFSSHSEGIRLNVE